MRRKCSAFRVLLILLCAATYGGCAAQTKSTLKANRGRDLPWRGVHILSPGKSKLPAVKRMISEALAPMGVNVLVFEVDYGFEYQSHPELRGDDPITKADAQELAALCRKHGIRLIPQFQCLGHQSWAKVTHPLLVKYPQFDETPKIPFDNPDIYCRSWCPLHPEVNQVVFALMDELIDAFQPDAFHVGMDEVFLIASEQCPRCKGKDPAELFAKAVNDYHRHLAGEKQLSLLIWGDRLLDADAMGYSEWEASRNGTAPAIDLIPKDIIICDWHYGLQDEYLSVPYFQEKGFRVWPSAWRDIQAAKALLNYSEDNASERMIGFLCTTWVGAEHVTRALLEEGPAADLPPNAGEVAAVIRTCMGASAQ